ncbi:MAG: hypothetical protein SWY16_21480 [Cyanobacteriota bacterium]|nr:hypothetical protein [Cyanobacteriota bacterium]
MQDSHESELGEVEAIEQKKSPGRGEPRIWEKFNDDILKFLILTSTGQLPISQHAFKANRPDDFFLKLLSYLILWQHPASVSFKLLAVLRCAFVPVTKCNKIINFCKQSIQIKLSTGG